MIFDNSAQTFVWVSNGDFTIPNKIFDPTRGPHEQQAFNLATGLGYAAFLGGGSNTVASDSISAGSSIRLLRSTTPVLIEPPFGGTPASFLPAVVLEVGAQLGLSGIDQEYADRAAMGYFNPNLDRQSLVGERPIIGFRVMLDDGLPHYGYIEFERRQGPLAGGFPGETILMFQPVRWAYETEPNTSITVVPAPGAAAALLLGAGALAGRRRRGRSV